jgi:hypothetical protein
MLVTDVLQRFPLSERRLHRHAKCMFIVFRMLFDRSMCPRNSAPTRQANRVLRQNFRQRVCELIAERREVGFCPHGFPPLSDHDECDE